MKTENCLYSFHKYKYPGTGYYVIYKGFIVFSGNKRECKTFIKRNSK